MKIESRQKLSEKKLLIYMDGVTFQECSLFHDDILIDTRKYIDGRNEKLEGFMTVEITLNEAYFLETIILKFQGVF